VSSILSGKGQVTVPAEVLRRLGLKAGDKLSFVIENESNVRVEASRYRDMASLRGAVGKLERPLSWEELRGIAREEH